MLPPSSLEQSIQTVKKKKFYQVLYFQVIVAIVVGILLGHFFPKHWRSNETTWRCVH